MITFNATSFTVTVECNTNPIEAWLETHNELVDCLQAENEDMHASRYNYLELLRAMMPDVPTAKKMTETKK